MLKKCSILLYGLFSFVLLQAQEFGGNPASVKWRKIDTDTVRVVFPAGLQATAQRAASVISHYQQNSPHTIGNHLRKVSIVLQGQTLISNAYVALAPYRSEWYLMAPQNPFELGAQNWTDNLAIHEFRHVQQYSNFNKGLSKVATFLLGEQGQALANAAAIPDWFFEGDAVYNESLYSQQGRGRLPLFFSSYGSLFLAGRKDAYMKLRNGSFRQYVPDHYDLGYLLVAYGRKKYGNDIWQKVTADAAAFRPLLYPFQGALKKHAGIGFQQFVGDAFSFYKDQWKPADTAVDKWITPVKPGDVVDAEYPYLADNGTIILVQSSKSHVSSFYSLSPAGDGKRIATRSIALAHYYSYRNGRIVYAAYQPDARWGNRAYQSIQELDIATGEEKTLVSHTRYFSPDISADGTKLLAVDMRTDGNASLVLMSRNGAVQQHFASPGLIYSHPKFSSDAAAVYTAARNAAGEMSLLKYPVGSERQPDTLVYSTNRLIGFLTVQRDTILFTTTYNGRDELWAVIDRQGGGGPFRLASYPTGLYQAVLTPDGKLVASVFTADGYRLARFTPKWQRVEQKNELRELYTGNQLNTDAGKFLSSVPARLFTDSKYAKTTGLFNFHSFRPWYDPPEYSLTLYGQNVLNTFQSQLAYTYNQNEQSQKAAFNGAYGGSFLQPVFGISNTWNRSGLLNKDTTLHWNELEWYAGLQLPLNLTRGKQYRYLTISGTYRSDQVSWTGIAQQHFANGNFQYLQTRISYSAQAQKAVQQLYPHFGQSLFLQFKNSLNGYTAQQFLASGSLYLPGLQNSHSLVLTAAYHGRDTMQQYLYSNNFPFARGYTGVDFPRMWKIGVNYHLPLVYPDWGFGQLVYFLRVRANLFFDYTEGKSLRTGAVYPFRTLGTEFFFDTRWWNQQPVSFGFRYSHLLDKEFRGLTQPDVWEFVLPVTLFY